MYVNTQVLINLETKILQDTEARISGAGYGTNTSQLAMEAEAARQRIAALNGLMLGGTMSIDPVTFYGHPNNIPYEIRRWLDSVSRQSMPNTATNPSGMNMTGATYNQYGTQVGMPQVATMNNMGYGMPNTAYNSTYNSMSGYRSPGMSYRGSSNVGMGQQVAGFTSNINVADNKTSIGSNRILSRATTTSVPQQNMMQQPVEQIKPVTPPKLVVDPDSMFPPFPVKGITVTRKEFSDTRVINTDSGPVNEDIIKLVYSISGTEVDTVSEPVLSDKTFTCMNIAQAISLEHAQGIKHPVVSLHMNTEEFPVLNQNTKAVESFFNTKHKDLKSVKAAIMEFNRIEPTIATWYETLITNTINTMIAFRARKDIRLEKFTLDIDEAIEEVEKRITNKDTYLTMVSILEQILDYINNNINLKIYSLKDVETQCSIAKVSLINKVIPMAHNAMGSAFAGVTPGVYNLTSKSAPSVHKALTRLFSDNRLKGGKSYYVLIGKVLMGVWWVNDDTLTIDIK